MAIGSVLVNPEKAQPVYTNGLFYAATSNKTSEYKFRYVWDVYLNGVKIYRGKTTPNPNGLGVFDVSNVVQNYLETTIKVEGYFPSSTYEIQITPFFSKQNNDYNYPQVKSLYVLIGEEYSTSPTAPPVIYNGYTDTPGEPAFSSDVSRVYNGTMVNNFLYRSEDFDFTPYIMRDNTNLFLTNSPRVMKVRTDDWYTLSFANYNWYTSDTYKSLPRAVKFDWYDSLGSLISTTTVDNIYSNGGGPWSACTDTEAVMVLAGVDAVDWNILNVGVGPQNTVSIRPSATTYYQVTMMGGDVVRPEPPSQNCGEISPAPPYEAATIRRCDDYQEFCASVEGDVAIGTTYLIEGYCYELISIGGLDDQPSSLFLTGTSFNTCEECLTAATPTCPTLSAVSETFSFDIDDECLKFNQRQLVWVNRYGTFDYYRFKAGKSEGIKIDRQEYKKYNINWGNASSTNLPQHLTSSRGSDVFNVNITETHVINTGFINFPDFQFLEGLYTSPDVYIVDENNTLTPIVITSTDFIRKNRGNTNIVNLELSYQYANNLKLNR